MFSPVAGRGFTLLECVVAVTVLSVGVLAVASTAAPIARLIRWGGAESAAAAAAEARLETLRAGGCSRLQSGTAVYGGRYHLEWRVDSGGALRRITLVASYAWGSGARRDSFETAVACAP